MTPWSDLRVFCRDGRGGNPLAVYVDPPLMSDEEMQQAAFAIGYSETVFTTSAGDLRIFTPAMELPFAGHPLVGTAWLLGVAELRPPPGAVQCGRDGAGSAWVLCNPAQAPPWKPMGLDSVAEVASYQPSPDDDGVGIYALGDGGSAKVRFFAPGSGVPEDPATGSFAVVLAAHLGRDLVIDQGDEIGVPCRIRVALEGDGRVRLSGEVAEHA